MPAKSQKQFKKMFVLAKEHEITPSQLKDFTHNVDYKHLPMVAPKKKKVGKPPEEMDETMPDDEMAEKKKK